jgi:hypothetical protein
MIVAAAELAVHAPQTLREIRVGRLDGGIVLRQGRELEQSRVGPGARAQSEAEAEGISIVDHAVR